MKHIPGATYRIQLNKDFTFKNLSEIINNLSALGITDIYASPILKARKGSSHCYDIVDQTILNPELGSEDEFEKLISHCKEKGLNWLQDIVPNHMAYSSENKMLIDLLENGPNSRYYNFFDIEWNYPLSRIKNRLLAPFLGKYYPEVLENGEIKLTIQEGGFRLNYYEMSLPIKIESYLDIISFRIDQLRNKLGRNDKDFIRLQGLIYALKSLPTLDDLDERYYQIKFIKNILWELYTSLPEIKVFIDENMKIINGNPSSKESFDFLDKLISSQHYRLAYWKVANEEINYRRFFNINDLISLNIENEDVFNRSHSLILRYVKEEKIKGLRIDHVDGLYNPAKYLKQLREKAKDSYIVIEKILELKEELPENWTVEGTTGYDFLNYVNGVFCRKNSEKKFTKIYQDFIGKQINYEELVIKKKKLFIKRRMAGEVTRLAYLLEEISGKDRYGIDITLNGLKEALEALLIHFPVYRTYTSKDNFYHNDEKILNETIKKVREKFSIISTEINYIGNLLLLKFNDRFNEEDKDKIFDFIMRFQQLTGPLMAKGFEDTTLYIYNRLISLNEVGGDPGKFGFSAKEFHKYNLKKLKTWPNALNTTSTHDTKRGEDVRARLNVLSEIPEEWKTKIKLWNNLNRNHKIKTDGRNFPDRNSEYFLYQTLVGTYPFSPDENYTGRIKEYLIKASREAKIFSSWVRPNEELEKNYTDFAEKILDDNSENEFLHDFRKFVKKVSFYGVYNSLSQLLIKITSPGVPDFYQGTELWDLSMVDPDNRREVDYKLREKMLKELLGKYQNNPQNFFEEILKSFEDGRVKLFLMNRSLQLRKENKELFNKGEYIPLKTDGEFKDNLIAFARRHESSWVITAIPRLLTSIIHEGELPTGTEKWKDTVILFPENIRLKNYLTGEEFGQSSCIKAGDVFKRFPAALLTGIVN